MEVVTQRTIAKNILETLKKSVKGVNDANEVVKAVFDEITKQLKAGETVRIHGFGSMKVVKAAARTGINPVTKEKIKIPAKKRVKFTSASALKEAVAKVSLKK